MFWPDQWCSIETLPNKTSQLLYHPELFKLVERPSSYDNSSWGVGGDISLRIHGPIVFHNRKRAMAKFNPHYLTLQHAARTTQSAKYSCMSHYSPSFHLS